MNWQAIEQFLYVVINYYWGVIAIGCAALMMLPYAIAILKEMRDRQ